MAIQAFLISQKDSPKIVNIQDNFDEYCKVLNCEYIEVVNVLIDGKLFGIICDEEGRLKENTLVTASAEKKYEKLFGNILIVNYKGFDFDSLSRKDIDIISGSITRTKGLKRHATYVLVYDERYRNVS